MAEKRMFTKKITESDAFLDMPSSSQCLYFHLNMNADDDGFVNNPKRIAKLVGASEDDLKLLIAKRFVLAFDTGVIVIKHWRMHNTIQKDRYRETDYQDEYEMLILKSNKSYTWKQFGNSLETQIRLDKNRDDDIQIERIEEAFGKEIVDKAVDLLQGYQYTEKDLLTVISKMDNMNNPDAYVYTMMKGKS